MKFLDKISAKANTAVVDKEKSASKAVKGYYAGIGAVAALAMASSPMFAASSGLSNIFKKVSESLKDVYKNIIGISSVIAVVFISICLVIRMVSKNQRSVEEATAWIKRIVITWLILNLLTFFLTYGQDLVQGGQFDNANNDW